MTEKIRIEFENIKGAKSYKNQYGGWIVKTLSKVFWYSCRYTATDIFNDIPGNLEIY